jgi:hypothetical protein
MACFVFLRPRTGCGIDCGWWIVGGPPQTAVPAPVMVQTWKLTAHGDISSVRNAESEVSAVLERLMTPTFGYAAFDV